MDEAGIKHVLGRLGVSRMKTQGGKVKASCPMAAWTHTSGVDKNPSFHIDIASGPSRFHCFTCKTSGKKMFSLLVAMRERCGIWYDDLLEYVDEREGGNPLKSMQGSYESAMMRSAKKKFRTQAEWQVSDWEPTFEWKDYEHLTAEIPAYAINRGITVPQAVRWRLGYDKERSRLFIPIFSREQKMVGWSERAIYDEQEPKYLHARHFNRQKYLFGEQFVDDRERVGFIMEGFMDVLALERFGLTNCLATFGTSCSKLHVDKLARWFDRVVIFPHNDKQTPEGDPPGLAMAKTYAAAINERGIKVLIAPTIRGRKDPGEWDRREFDMVWSRISSFVGLREVSVHGDDRSTTAEETGSQEGTARNPQQDGGADTRSTDVW